MLRLLPPLLAFTLMTAVGGSAAAADAHIVVTGSAGSRLASAVGQRLPLTAQSRAEITFLVRSEINGLDREAAVIRLGELGMSCDRDDYCIFMIDYPEGAASLPAEERAAPGANYWVSALVRRDGSNAVLDGISGPRPPK